MFMNGIFRFLVSLQLATCMCSSLSSSISNTIPLNFEYYGGETTIKSTRLDSNFLSHSNKDESQYTKTGTTIVGICCRDGVVLGADTRSTGGPLVMNKNTLKIHYVSPNIRCCAAGTSADCKQITRKTNHHLSLLRIEHELAGETEHDFLDSVSSAVTFISNYIRNNRSPKDQQERQRKVSSVQILGGVDLHGPGLFQIDEEGVPMRIAFGSLGSGSINALSVLESERRAYRLRSRSSGTSSGDSGGGVGSSGGGSSISDSTNSGVSTSESNNINTHTNNVHTNNIHINNMVNRAILDGHCENITVAEAVGIVRRAVRSGILNDMGSGSHVDLCVISTSFSVGAGTSSGSVGGDVSSGSVGKSSTTHTSGGVYVRQWREEMDSTWETDRLTSSTVGSGSSVGSTSISSVTGSASSDNTHTTTTTDTNTHSTTTTSTNTHTSTATTDVTTLGRRVFSRFRPVRRLFNDTVYESVGTTPVDDMICCNVELVE